MWYILPASALAGARAIAPATVPGRNRRFLMTQTVIERAPCHTVPGGAAPARGAWLYLPPPPPRLRAWG